MNIIKGKINRPTKMVIYGVEGIGKTTLAASIPNVLLIDLEKGSGQNDVDRIEVETWENLIATLRQLSKEAHPYQTIAIDSANWAEDMCSRYILERDGKSSIEGYGYGKGYKLLEEEFNVMFSKLRELERKGLNLIILAHSEIKKIELPDQAGGFDKYEIRLNKNNKGTLKEWGDSVLFLNYKTIVVDKGGGKNKAIGGKERYIYTEHDATYDAKNRYGLPSEIPYKDKKAPQEILNLFTNLSTVTPKPTLEALKKLLYDDRIEESQVLTFLKDKGVGDFKTLEEIPSNVIERLVARWKTIKFNE